MPELVIKIKGDKVVVDAIGFKGRACEKEINDILEKLAKMGLKMQVEDVHYKPEYNEVTITGRSKQMVKTGE